MTHVERHEQRRAIVSALRAEQKVADVAVQFAVNEPYVRRIGLYAGVLEPPQPMPRAGQVYKPSRAVAILAALLNTDDSQSEVARKLKVTAQRVSQIMRDATAAGIAIPGRNGVQP